MAELFLWLIYSSTVKPPFWEKISKDLFSIQMVQKVHFLVYFHSGRFFFLEVLETRSDLVLLHLSYNRAGVLDYPWDYRQTCCCCCQILRKTVSMHSTHNYTVIAVTHTVFRDKDSNKEAECFFHALSSLFTNAAFVRVKEAISDKCSYFLFRYILWSHCSTLSPKNYVHDWFAIANIYGIDYVWNWMPPKLNFFINISNTLLPVQSMHNNCNCQVYYLFSL